ncbi:hypothetical protein sync_0658 [Synechococcus sp. CC9311]|nr:hypothetical protein sync_0658 [Synechococcus sp. CC9311]
MLNKFDGISCLPIGSDTAWLLSAVYEEVFD